MKMYTNVRFARSPEAKVTGQVPGDLSFLAGPPAWPPCTVAPRRGRPRALSFWVSKKSQQPGFLWKLPYFSNPVWVKVATFPGSRFYLWRELRKNPAKEEPPRVSALTSCIRRGAAISRCLICSQTICNIIKSFPNHTHHLANTKINKTEQNELCQK